MLKSFEMQKKTIIQFLLVLLSLLSFFGCEQKITEITPTTRRFTIDSGDTLSKSLAGTNLPPADCDAIIANLQKVFNPRKIKQNDVYDIVTDTTSNWLSFIYYPAGLNYYSVNKSSDGQITCETKKFKSTTEEVSASGTVKTSLWESMRSQKIDPDVIVNFAEVFAWQVDFLTDTQPGDSYRLIWEKQVLENGAAMNKDIIGAEYVASGKIHTAVLFTGSDTSKGYFNPKGESLFRAFLKAPLQYRRISSFFTLNRYHPILKRFRPHLGIDYAAPSGTPVSSIGEGTVISAGWSGGFGRRVVIRHSNGYESAYAHLSGFGKKIHPGARVTQGQVIGYVGMSGLATGPHLDFRISKDGTFINFLKLKIPASRNISAKDKPSFKENSSKILSELAIIRSKT